MIDTEKISSTGKVGEEGYKNEKTVHPVNNHLNLMTSKNAAFFPGTYLKDYGGFYLPVMPVVINGKIFERSKFTSEEKVDSYEELARQLMGTRYAKKVSAAGGGFLVDEPYKTLIAEMKKKSERLRTPRGFSYKGLNLAPVICNEIDRFPELYTGKPLDILLHSADGLYSTHEQRMKQYSQFMRQLSSQGKLSPDTILATAESGRNPFTGVFSYTPIS
jgi:hypothetical protein